jgi:murein DD-endopeptidase MepM/ murein hydrolase activator NlpD
METKSKGILARFIETLIGIGLGESLLRTGTAVLSVTLLVVVVWLVRLFYAQGPNAQNVESPPVTVPTLAVEGIAEVPQDTVDSFGGVPRLAQVHTTIPSRPRTEIIKYVVQKGDTVSGIAEMFGLKSKTIYAANYEILQDDPHSLRPGQELKILPLDGVYWEWLGGIPFGQWAEYFHVKPEDIINYPANNLDPAAVGDPQNANIKEGTFLIVPNGEYQYHTPGQMPLGITRSNPASAQVAGNGSCGAVEGGAVGTGTFVYPTDKHTLSGFDYSVDSHHLGLDFAAVLGANIYATDGGVVVYAGENSYGYGNMVMIDHGTGFQSLYAHLSAIFVGCGESVSQGQTIGSSGETGNASGAHLHFEVRTMSSVINPWDVLPAP